MLKRRLANGSQCCTADEASVYTGGACLQFSVDRLQGVQTFHTDAENSDLLRLVVHVTNCHSTHTSA